MDFEQIREMLDTHARTLFSVHSNSFASGDVCHDVFSSWSGIIESSNSKIEFDKDLLSEEETSDFIE